MGQFEKVLVKRGYFKGQFFGAIFWGSLETLNCLSLFPVSEKFPEAVQIAPSVLESFWGGK